MTNLLTEEFYNRLKDVSLKIITPAVDNIVENFCTWKAHHPDANTSKLEQNIAQAVWTLLKADEEIFRAATDLQIYLDEDNP